MRSKYIKKANQLTYSNIQSHPSALYSPSNRDNTANRHYQQSIQSLMKHQLKFISYHDQLKHLKEHKQSHPSSNTQKQPPNQQKITHDESNQFTPEERQQLKNAFRYISRLIFKESSKYKHKIDEIASMLKSKSKSRYDTPTDSLNLFIDAELISGERYFNQYLNSLASASKVIVLKFMIWFLKHKYLRYIYNYANGQKGKRKEMKKQLYIRFKNTIMLPYLQKQLQIEQISEEE